MRLNLAQALMCPSDLLLLDEPTNHLDLDAILWVEEWLKRYAGTLLVVSHDRDFLDGVVNVILHIDQKKLRRYARQLLGFRGAARAVDHPRREPAREAGARARPPAVLHRPLQGQGHQGAPGAEPHEDAGEDGGPRAAARRRRRSRSNSASRCGRPTRCWCWRTRTAGYGDEDRAAGHQFLAAVGAALRPARHQRRGQVHADQDHRRRTRSR